MAEWEISLLLEGVAKHLYHTYQGKGSLRKFLSKRIRVSLELEELSGSTVQDGLERGKIR